MKIKYWKIKIFCVGTIIGICISMLITTFIFSPNDKISLDTPYKLQNKPTQSPLHHISLFDQIKSPINQIPIPLNQTSNTAITLKHQRHNYGGSDTVIDAKHLGGFFPNDTNSYEPQMWEWAIHKFNIKSVLDVGCGMGYSSLFFVKHPKIERVLCVEGSSDAINRSLVSAFTVQHDYTLGPYWPVETYDMVWCVEFLEHVDEKYMDYYMATFKKAKYIFVTGAVLGGWHHVNMKKPKYWINVFTSYGFVYLDDITHEARSNCPNRAWQLKYSYHDTKTTGDRKNPYFLRTGLVFFNSLFFESNKTLSNRNMTLFDEMLLKEIHSYGNKS
eukprot:277804_1